MPAEKFSKPPSGAALNSEDIQKVVNDEGAVKLDEVAEALGGSVQESPEKLDAPVPIVDGVEVPVEDRREYVRTLLAGEPYIREYPLFGGALKVSFKTRTTEENDSVDKNFHALFQEYRYKQPNIIQERLTLCISLVSLSVGDHVVEGPLTLADLKEINELAFAAIRKSFRDFEKLCDEMFQKANDVNFWKETAGTT